MSDAEKGVFTAITFDNSFIYPVSALHLRALFRGEIPSHSARHLGVEAVYFYAFHRWFGVGGYHIVNFLTAHKDSNLILIFEDPSTKNRVFPL